MGYLKRYRNPIIGGIVAVVISTIGFWKMILLLILISLDAMVGSFSKKIEIIK
ncbi:DUF2273 domain-containing protein [Lactococcus ileimucosae]|uniref:DUF2273 domain-containing protein n=1 Tax=Lactococcus ileimucosae TaxID=2941329 RepID=UPI003514A487